MTNFFEQKLGQRDNVLLGQKSDVDLWSRNQNLMWNSLTPLVTEMVQTKKNNSQEAKILVF